MDIIENYIGEIIIGVGISFVLGLVATVKAFFSGINRMEKKLDELEQRIIHNEVRDADLKSWVRDLVKQNMK